MEGVKKRLTRVCFAIISPIKRYCAAITQVVFFVFFFLIKRCLHELNGSCNTNLLTIPKLNFRYEEMYLILHHIIRYLYRPKHFSVFPGDDHGFLMVSFSHCFILGCVFFCAGQYFCIVIQTKWFCNVLQLLLLRFNSNTVMWQLQLDASGEWRAVLLSTPRAHKSTPANCSHLGLGMIQRSGWGIYSSLLCLSSEPKVIFLKKKMQIELMSKSCWKLFVVISSRTSWQVHTVITAFIAGNVTQGCLILKTSELKQFLCWIFS